MASLLFDTPGWTVPGSVTSGSAASSSKKQRERKEPPQLARSGGATGAPEIKDAITPQSSVEEQAGRKKKRKQHKSEGERGVNGRDASRHESPTAGKTSQGDERGKVKAANGKLAGKLDRGDEAAARAGATSSGTTRSMQGKKRIRHATAASSIVAPSSTCAAPSASATGISERTPTFQSPHLAALAGARFRILNETLYTSPGSKAHALMSEDPESFAAYHSGFRAQVKSWPVNPVDVLVEKIRRSAKGKSAVVVADLGCGEAALAKALMAAEGPQNGARDGGCDFRVASFDLRPDNEGWVTEADCSSLVPLPGSLTVDLAQIVDIVVCCLSLMGTDWVSILIEARRILRSGGTIHVAEVASRLPTPTTLGAFSAFLADSLGFRLIQEDTRSSTHFVIFEFRKDPVTSEQETALADTRDAIIEKGKGLLKPCIYKRR